ncbi:acyltransferase family protein [Pseudonocardia xishanensis]|uniref:Peptidoglycan O-acetyltransferase OatA n=1 Tax=Pseudonocardia xishanensis TaxID=630995 RepID=A0ABP8RVQ0_9PSEU
MATLEGSRAPARPRAVPVRVRPVRNPFAVPHAPGLDGLRALAVLAVVAYHLDLGWAGGGFLGVEVFFTLSGFLITQLLVAELRRHGRIDVRGFVLARARRLVPALVLAVLGTLVLVAVLLPANAPGLRGDALASLTWLQNWHLLIGGVPYSESFARPSPFLHLWSLAVEAQLYVVWPLLFAGVLAVLGRRRVAVAALLLAFVSAVACAWRFDPDASGAAYYATDARASGFLIGAATALLWLPAAWRPRSPAARTAFDLVGVTALVALLLGLGTASEFASDLYLHGGFLRTGLVTAVVLVAATGAGPAVSGLLARAPLVAVGKRSYGIYLYHWPILVLTRPTGDLAAHGWLLDLGRVLATLLVAEASYRWVETPIRRGAIRRMTQRVRLNRLAAGVVGGCVAALTVSAVFALTAPAGLVSHAPTSATDLAAAGPGTDPPAPPPAPSALPGPGAARAEPVPAAPTTPVALGPAYVLGDSIALGSAQAITAALGPGTTVDAEVGRQYAGAPEAVRSWAARNPGPVVVDLGANGTVEADDVESVIAAAEDRPVVLVGVSVPRRWEAGNNAVLRAAAERHAPTVRFVDWGALVAADPGLLGPDDVHPTVRGRTVLAEAIRRALA